MSRFIDNEDGRHTKSPAIKRPELRKLNGYKPRVNVTLSEEQDAGLDKYLGEYGMKKIVIRQLIDSFIFACENGDPGLVIGGIVAKKVGMSDLLGGETHETWFEERLKAYLGEHKNDATLPEFVRFIRGR